MPRFKMEPSLEMVAKQVRLPKRHKPTRMTTHGHPHPKETDWTVYRCPKCRHVATLRIATQVVLCNGHILRSIKQEEADERS